MMSLITELLVPALFSLNSYLKYNSDISINSILSWKYTIEMLLGKQNYKVEVYFVSICGYWVWLDHARNGTTQIGDDGDFI